jgi:hypothetical protein
MFALPRVMTMACMAFGGAFATGAMFGVGSVVGLCLACRAMQQHPSGRTGAAGSSGATRSDAPGPGAGSAMPRPPEGTP